MKSVTGLLMLSLGCDLYNRLRKLKCPAAMLWGCSSGALVRNGIHDPIGAPVSYLLSGAPWVIGNLWDVTDRDIDRLSVSCMEKVFDSVKAGEWWEQCGRLNVSLSLCDSREVCKLKSAVGSAAVMYGLPVGMKIK
jgi:separase